MRQGFVIDKESVGRMRMELNVREGSWALPQRPWGAKECRGAFLLVAFFLVGGILVSPIFPTSGLVQVLLLPFLILAFVDYLLYRAYAATKFRQDLVNLSVLLEKETLGDFYRKGGNPTDETEGASSAPQEERVLYPAMEVQKEAVQRQIDTGNLCGKMVLDAGCGTGEIAALFATGGNYVAATELSLKDLAKVPQGGKLRRICSDVQSLPFKDGAFEGANCTDLLEHLENPGKTLQELSRVLKTGAWLLLSTPSGHSPFLEEVYNPVNPLVLIEKACSLFCEKLLPPRRLMQRFFAGEGRFVYVYHTAFSKGNLATMLEESGFRVGWCASYGFLNRGFSFLAFLAPFLTPDRKKRSVLGVERFFSRLPVMNLLGANLLLVARKR